MEASRMLLFSPISSCSVRGKQFNQSLRKPSSRTALKIVGMAKEGSETSNGIIEKSAIAGGLVSVPVIAWSLYTLKTTGCGLPPGPGGSIGALEGVSYLVVVGIVAWSVYTKTKTGSGLPNGLSGCWVPLKACPIWHWLPLWLCSGCSTLTRVTSLLLSPPISALARFSHCPYDDVI
ncbi:hypothetical protein E2542_SST06662 [Spatholobus suberectus]|nr:hypothetical protein E2542_SST06662 [Spatholobus suberectus]